jgi:uncharacterized protein (TIGR02466 family)
MSTTVIPIGGFPLYIVETENVLTENQKQFIFDIEDFKATGTSSVYISNTDSVLEHEELSDLKTFFKKHLDIYTSDTLQLESNFEITDSWTTRQETNGSHHRHNHPNSIFSGVYYVNADAGNLVLEFDPLYSKYFRFNYKIKEYNIYNSNAWDIHVKPGLLVLFPSYLQHYTRKNSGVNNRMIVGFNSFLCDDLTGHNENISVKF